MRSILIKLLYFFVIISFIFFFMYITTDTLLCEHPQPEADDNLFYRIVDKDTRSWSRQNSRAVWEVLFKNVNIKYEVTQSTGPPFNNYYYTFKTDTDSIECTKLTGGLKEAVVWHFNEIQTGMHHPNRPNFINPNAHGKGIKSPLDQFEIRNFLSLDAPILGNFHISYTNIGLYLTISAFMALALNLLATNYNKVIANKWSISQESIYATIHSIVINQINEKDGQKYYPFIYTLFIIILTSNLIGMIPYSFASTSHFILTFFLSFSIVLGSTILGFLLHKTKFFSLFVPSGCPLGLLPLLVLIEFISFLARNVSLGLRLAANILSGHMLLNILSDFTYKIMETNIFYFFLGLIPLMFIIAFSALELGIAFIQSQVFVVLSSSYIKDSLELH